MTNLSNLSIDELNELMEQRKKEIEQERVEHVKQTYMKQLNKYTRFMNKMNSQEKNVEWYCQRIVSLKEKCREAIRTLKYVHHFSNEQSVRDIEAFTIHTNIIIDTVNEMMFTYNKQSDEWKTTIERIISEEQWKKERERFLKEEMK